MNKAALSICVQVLCGDVFSTLLGEYQGACLLDYMVRVCLILKDAAQLPCKVAAPSCVPTSSEGSGRSASSPAFGVVSALDLGHSQRCGVVSHCCFNLHFPDDI